MAPHPGDARESYSRPGRRPRWGPVLGAVLLAGLAGCRSAPKASVFDLARDATLADWIGPGGASLLVAPLAEIESGPWRGQRRGRRAPGPPPAGALEQRLFARWPAPAPRDALLRLESGPGAAAVEVRLNRTGLERVVLREGVHTYRVPLPVEGQSVGMNTLRLTFEPREGEEPPFGDPFGGAVVLPAGHAASDAIVGDDLPLVDLAGSGEHLRLVHVAPVRLRYAVRLPARARLRVSVRPLRAGPPARAYGVTLERAAGPPTEIVAGTTRRDGTPREHVVELPGSEGDFVWLSLHAGPDPDGLAGVEWSSPRVTGEPTTPPSTSAVAERRLAALRASLRGLSVIFVVIDAARARQFSTYGYERATTLEIDRLGREGVVFDRAYTPATYTRSAMSSVWTSLYHEQHHAGVGYLAALPANHRTLAEILDERGVATSGFVANPAAGPSFGLDRGFSTFRLFRGRDGRVAPRAGELLDALAPHFEELAASGRRFFTYVHFIEPHYPYDPPPRFVTLFGPDEPIPERVRRRTGWIEAVNHGRRPFPPAEQAHLVRLYDGSLAYVDREIGELRRLLEASGLLDRVVLIVTADHGDELYERGLIGHGSRVYDEQLRIPLVIRFPRGAGPEGERVQEPVDLVDLAPTVLDAMGLEASGGEGFEGHSVLPLLFGGRGKEVLVGRTMHERPAFSYREGPWKLVHSVRSGRIELYQVEDDPGETRDRARDEPVRAAAFREALYRWLRDLPRDRAAALPTTVSDEDREALRALGYTE